VSLAVIILAVYAALVSGVAVALIVARRTRPGWLTERMDRALHGDALDGADD